MSTTLPRPATGSAPGTSTTAAAPEPGAVPYGFGHGLSDAFPSQVIIDAPELCSLSCTHCPHPAAYRRAPYFEVYRACFEELYLRRPWSTLSELNQALVTGIARDLLGIATPYVDSRTFPLTQSKGGRVVELLQHVGASAYVSGPSAKAYITDERFLAAGIAVEWKNYQGYPEYNQFHRPFVHAVTILDLLFHTGPNAPYYIWGWRAAGRVAA